ncbi:hypothetical protein JHD47_00925 [Sulfurimonas sp. SAG-AH-194-L11]|nr:hypothetical protein [Sulfurimonas sp. SAG-AH-194-L11]MDF1876378.1 hypothetical protein [Sulfurimonas sp. SAG-AH-194-L11]
MLIKHSCYKARSTITAFTLRDDDTIALSTAVHGAKIFSHQKCSAVKNLSIESLGQKTTAVSFSQDSNLLAFANDNIIYIINTQNKLLVQKIRTYEGTIQLIEFVPNSKYFVTGTKDGRVMQYRYDGRAGLSRLCSFGQLEKKNTRAIKNNYVSAFAFYDNLLACSGYGGSITILKIHSLASKYTIPPCSLRINALCFFDKEKLLSGGVDGLLHIHSLKHKQIETSISTPFTNIKKILIMPNPQYVMLSGASEQLCIIDIKNTKLVSPSYLTFKHNVLNITLTQKDNLLVVLESKEFFKVELPKVEHLKSFILSGDLDKAYALIDMDPMLKDTREHKRVEVMYAKLYTQAIEALINSNTKEARMLMRKFKDVKSKKDDINSIFKAFEFYPRFNTLYLEKKYALSYALAEKHPALKYTKQYKKMEEVFKEAYAFAQKQILLGRHDVAKEILGVYATVLSKKPMLHLILKQNEEFIDFLKAINDKNFTTIEKLVKKNEIFSQIPTYIALNKSIQVTLDTIQNYINKGEVRSAIETIKMHLQTTSIKEELQDLYKDAKLVQKLQESYKNNDFKSCYEIIDSSNNLYALELSKLLEDHWIKLVSECEEYAFRGEFSSIKKKFGELIGIQTRLEKIGDLLRLSFHIKIKALLSKKSFKNSENIIYSYIDIFGTDSEMLLIMRTYERVSGKDLALTLNQDIRKERDSWLNSPIVRS